MTKVQFDVSESDPVEAQKATGGFESPRPGRYHGEVLEVTAKGSGGDPKKPMLEVVFQLIAADKDDNQRFVDQNSRLWGYYLLPGHPSYQGFSVLKTDQFLQAAGLASVRKRKGTFDTDDIEGAIIGINVRAGKNLDGDYRGEIGSVFAVDEGEALVSGEEDDEDLRGLDVVPDEPGDDSEPESDEEVPPYEEWSLAELKEEAEARELATTGNKARIIARLEEDDESEEEEEAEDESGDGDDDDPFAG
jgi:hypothetical protein